MFSRLITTLWALCLLASLNGFGVHAHEPSHGHDKGQEHVHVVSSLDADHAKLHAEGGTDDEGGKIGTRSAPDLPQMAPAPAPIMAVIVDGEATSLPLLADQHVTGPPRYLQPPSQAPPQVSLTV